jgi:phage protein D
VSEGDIDRFKRVKAYWHDREAARRREIVIEVDPEATGDHVLRDPYATREEAKAAAESAGRDMLGGLVETECSVAGRPALMAGQPIIYAGVHPRFDGREFILDLVTHSFSKPGGLRTSFTGKLKTASKQPPASTATGAGASP